MSEPEYFSAREAARRLGISDTTLRNWIANGSVRATRDGRRWQISFEEIERCQRSRQPREEVANAPSHTSYEEVGIESEILRAKLAASEREHEATRRHLEDSRAEIEHLRSQCSALTHEVQGLTAIIHQSRLALPSPAGWLRGVVRQIVGFRV